MATGYHPWSGAVPSAPGAATRRSQLSPCGQLRGSHAQLVTRRAAGPLAMLLRGSGSAPGPAEGELPYVPAWLTALHREGLARGAHTPTPRQREALHPGEQKPAGFQEKQLKLTSRALLGHAGLGAGDARHRGRIEPGAWRRNTWDRR
jgi:hypothetical protein